MPISQRKGGRQGKDQPDKVAGATGGDNIGERERTSPELLKKCREEKFASSSRYCQVRQRTGL